MNTGDDPNTTADRVPRQDQVADTTAFRTGDPLGTIDHSHSPLSTDDIRNGGKALSSELPDVPGYRVVGEIARGGMGRVVAAVDLTLDRDVAIKVLLPGANADRFVRESKVTARLPHPGIPPIYALGTLADGGPFLAMKLVAGRTLAAVMTTTDRPRLLQTFTQVCQAVGFAHSRGVIHRDLKPANVMVGAFGEVQVMDWGLAKDSTLQEISGEPRSSEVQPPPPLSGQEGVRTTDRRGPAESTDDETRAGAVMGTPAYMAPEQARGEVSDARSDVFALGGILCAILTGQPPFHGPSSREVIRRAGSADLADAHARLDSCGADADLVTLCKNCLSPSPSNRPSDGQAVADGMTSYLSGVEERLRTAEIARGAEAARATEATLTAAEAVERARAERRARRVQVVAAGLVLVILAGGIAGTGLGLVRALQAEKETKRRADELQRVADYQAKMLQQVDPAAAGVGLMEDLRTRHAAALAKSDIPEDERSARKAAFSRELYIVNATDTAVSVIDRTVLAPAARTLDEQFADQPLVDASLRMTLGNAYSQIGRFEQALVLYRKAYELRAATLGERHQDTLTALSAVVHELILLQQIEEAEASLPRLIEAYRDTLGSDHPDALTARSYWGSLLHTQGKLEEWEACSRDVLERRSRVLGKGHLDTLTTMHSLGTCLLLRDKYPEAEGLLRTVLEESRGLSGQGQRLFIDALSSLSKALNAQGKFSEALPFLREALEKSRQECGEDHPDTLITLNNLVVNLQSQGKPTETEPLARELLDKTRRLRGNEHRETLVTLNVMGRVYALQGKYSEAEPYWREALTTGRRVLGEDHPDTAAWINNLGSLLVAQQKLTEGEPLVLEALAKFRKAYGNDHSSTITALGNLGALQRDLGKLSEAEACFREALERSRRTRGEEIPATLTAIIRLGELLAMRGDSAEAVSLLATAEPKARVTFLKSNRRNVATLLEALGQARTSLAKSHADFAIAEANLLEAHKLFVETRGPNSKEVRGCIRTISNTYSAWHKTEPSKGYDTKAATWKAKLPNELAPPPRERM